MKNVISILMSAVLLMGTAFATDVTFQGVKVADAKGKQTDAQLVFSDIQKKVIINVAGREFLTVPYESIDKVSYEYTKKHRVTQGAIVMVASLGAGAIVMLTKSKSHWLYIDFHEQGSPKSVVLRMDKNEYKQIMAAVPEHTGKTVEAPVDSKAKSQSSVAESKKPVEAKPAETKPVTDTKPVNELK